MSLQAAQLQFATSDSSTNYNLAMSAISFGDTVRIRATDDTKRLGWAGRTGMIYGMTTPSVTGVQVIGSTANDRALAVMFDGQKDPLWFDPDLIEFVDHTPGTTATLGSKRFTRNSAGEWIEDFSLKNNGETGH